MSMLAESRKRYKWVYNPRGQDWVNDDNKFGQKLMEKMGWAKGKGLGREEQGNVDHIEVSVKNDSKGIGYKVTDDAWIKHYEGFENVLAALNSENNSAAASPSGSAPNSTFNSDDEGTKVSSLEALSKGSQARVHYHKFTRGKDLSRLNSDDIACITGSKRSKKLAKLAKEEDFQEEEVGHTQHNGGLTTINGGNIQDYFAKKWAAIKGKTSQQEDATEVCGSSDLLAESKDAVDEPDIGLCLKKKEKKKRKKEVSIDDEMHSHPDMFLQEYKEEGTEKKSRKVRDREIKEYSERKAEDQDNHNISLEEPQRKKKKKRLSKSGENVNIEESVKISTNLEEAPPKKKKKSKRSLEENEMEVEHASETACVVEESEVVLDNERDVKKLKKKEKKVNCMDESEYKDVNDSSLYMGDPPKKKKKLGSEEKAVETIESARDLNENKMVSDMKKEDEGYLENDELVHKKKKKKSKSNDTKDNFDESSISEFKHSAGFCPKPIKTNKQSEFKHKKKKKNKHRES